MSSSDAETKRAFSDTPWGKAAMLAGVLILAVVAARSCASRDTPVSQEQAKTIAAKEVDFDAEQVMARFVPRGFQSRPTWAVSFSDKAEDGTLERVTVVVVDANDGHVIEIRKQR
jgi:uncharacterized membrane protein YkoI